MSFRFSVLASGSTGNAVYVETKGQRLLIDCGLSGKKMTALFAKIGVDPTTLDGILVTHEHSDHVKGLGVFARRFNMPIYANEKTWKAMEHNIGTIPSEQKFLFKMETVKTFGDLDVESFGVSHDAVDPMFFTCQYEGKKLTLLTDVGYISERIIGTVCESDTLIFEANHDIQMLMMGHYPWNVKRRILGDLGHISNEDAALALSDIICDRTKRIYLAHLSKDNNMKDLARMSVKQTLEEKGFHVGDQFELYDTDPEEPTKLTAV